MPRLPCLTGQRSGIYALRSKTVSRGIPRVARHATLPAWLGSTRFRSPPVLPPCGSGRVPRLLTRSSTQLPFLAHRILHCLIAGRFDPLEGAATARGTRTPDRKSRGSAWGDFAAIPPASHLTARTGLRHSGQLPKGDIATASLPSELVRMTCPQSERSAFQAARPFAPPGPFHDPSKRMARKDEHAQNLLMTAAISGVQRIVG